MFHVSLLKKKIGEVAIANDELPPLTEEGAIRLQPRKVLSTRWVNKGSTSASESLVLWEGLPEEEATWEDSQQLLRSFPNLNLEDKVLIERGSIDESQVGTRSSRPRRERHPNPKYAA